MVERVTIAAQGDPSVIEVEKVTLSRPAPGEVRLRQTAIGVNFMDVYQRSGAYPLELPSGLGLEAVGIVEALGAGVDQVNVGDASPMPAVRPAPMQAIATGRLIVW